MSTKRTVDGACWTPEESVDVQQRRKQARTDAGSFQAGTSLRARLDALEQRPKQTSCPESLPLICPVRPTPPQPPPPPPPPRQQQQPKRLTKEQRERTERNRRGALLLQCTSMGERWQQSGLKPLNEWEDEPMQLLLEHYLARARRECREFDALRVLALTCKRLADMYALHSKAPVSLIVRYVDAFMREKVQRRKFEMDNTPTKASLEPYYQFERERDPDAPENHFPTCTLTAPAVRACWKGVKGVPMAVFSKAADASWHDRSSATEGDWDRIKTKTWSIRNPLTRLVSMYAQIHTECEHAPVVQAWVTRVKKEWPLAKQRKPWKDLIDWHERPIVS